MPEQAAGLVVEQVVPTQHAPEQGLGEQTVPTPRKTAPPMQLAWHVVVQAVPIVGQHAPARHGLGVQVLPMPMKAPTAPHPAAVGGIAHPQLDEAQHTPQGLGEQVMPATWSVPEGQPTVVTMLQAPVAMSQQVPQAAEAQAVPQRKRLGAAQLVGSTVTQAPVAGLQHAPVHGLEVQELLGPAKTDPAGQPVSRSIMVQAQVVVLQHAPLHEN